MKVQRCVRAARGGERAARGGERAARGGERAARQKKVRMLPPQNTTATDEFRLFYSPSWMLSFFVPLQ